jgi:hypothetical protein
MQYLADSGKLAIGLIQPDLRESWIRNSARTHRPAARILALLTTVLAFCAVPQSVIALSFHAETLPAAVTTGRTPVIKIITEDALPEKSASAASAPILVVTTNIDDTGSAANCTAQKKSGAGTDAHCSLRDALLFAAAHGSGNISFSSKVFKASNTAAENTINLANIPKVVVPVPLVIPANTTITGPTTVSGGIPINLVTITGVIGNVNTNGTVTLSIGAGVTNAVVNSLNLTGGQGAIANAGSLDVTGCVITGNTSYTGGGGIENSGTLTVSTTTIANNIAGTYPETNGGSSGGGIYNTGTLTVIASTLSGNIASGTTIYGGAIYNTGSLTVLNSTITGNTSASGQGGGAPFSGGGGGIYSSATGTLTITNSTITGNSVTGISSMLSGTGGIGGGGINGTATLANTIVSGNSSNLGNQDITGAYTDKGGNVVSLPTYLGSLASNGGPTQTMLPDPGNDTYVICGGTVANASDAGLKTDQRGLPRKTTYGETVCVDAGAVQTNYSLDFTTQPPAKASIGQPLTPAPVVQLTESGNPATLSVDSVTLSDSAALLIGTDTVSLNNGSVSFSDAYLSASVKNDKLTASMPVTGTLEVSAHAKVKVSVAPGPAVLVSPAPGSTLTSATVTFQWSPSDIPGTQYALQIGTTGPGSNDVYLSGPLTGTSVTVPVPTTGGTLYVGLSQGTTGPWTYTAYTYTEATQAAMVSPAPGSALTSATVTFQWSASTIPGTQYGLQVGTTGPGSKDVYLSGPLTGTSVTVTVPVTGAKLYVGLSQGTTGPWTYTPYTYTEATPAAMVSPAPGSALTSATVTFQWSASTIPGTQYGLQIGTTGPGSKDVYLSGPLTGTSVTVPVPVTGATLYVGLSQGTTGPWVYTPYTYTEATPAAMVAPAPGSALTSATVTFQWSASTIPGTQYGLQIGTTGPGSKDVYLSPPLTGTSVTVSVPVTGATLYVGLSQGTTGPWAYTPYTYTEATPAAMVSPAPGGALTSGTVTFQWSASTIPGTQYGLQIGTTGPGSKDVYLSPPLTGTSVTVPVPVTGATLYVGLSQGTTGPWAYTPYTYTEATPAALISPAPGSILTSGTVTFQWSPSTIPGTQYGLQIGTTGPGSKDVYLSPPLTGTSVTVPVPTTGATLYVALSQGTTGQWSYTPYAFTEATQ